MRYTHAHRNIVLTIVAAVILITASYAAFGWSDPQSAPPEANINLPLDTGGADQTKSGALKVKSLTTTGAIGVGTDPVGYQLNVNGSFNATGLSISGVQKNTVWDAKEPEIFPGTTVQYLRGDKTWQALNTTAVDEGNNLYFTDARARSAITGGASTITANNLPSNRALLSNSDGKVAVSAVTNTELGYLTGVTSALQTQLNARAPLASPQFTENVTMPGTGIWDSSGNVGIGTTSPTGILHLKNATVGDDGQPALVMEDRNSGLGEVRLQWDGTNNGAAFEFWLNDNSASSILTNRMTIKPNGKVGIGTTAPTAILHIVNNAAAQVGQKIVGAASQSADLTQWQNSSASVLAMVDASGNFGIGLSTPSSRLHIKDTNPDIILQPSDARDQGSLLEFRTYTNQGGMALWRDVERTGINSFAVRDQAAGIVRLYIGSGGNVGIGTTAPKSALHVPDGKYAQFENNNVGAPPAADCDSDTERGRISLDTVNNRLYICNGAARGWDWIGLSD